MFNLRVEPPIVQVMLSMSNPFLLPALFSPLPTYVTKRPPVQQNQDSTEDQLRWFSQLQNAFSEKPEQKKSLASPMEQGGVE